MPTSFTVRWVLPALVLLAAALPAQGSGTPAAERIRAAAKAVAESATVAPETKAAVASIYAAALDFVQAANESQTAAEQAREAAEAAPSLLVEIRRQLEQDPAPHQTVAQFARLELPELESKLTTARSATAQLESRLQARSSEQQQRTARLTAIPGLIAEASTAVTRLEATQVEAAPDEASEITAARAAERSAQLEALRLNRSKLEAEQLQFEAETALLIAQRDLLDRQLRHQSDLVEILDQAVQERRRRDAATDANTADTEAQRVHATWADLAAANQILAAERESWLERQAETESELKAARERYEALHSRFQTLEQRVARIRLNDVIGLQLRQEKARLPKTRRLLASIEARRDKLIEAQLAEFAIEDRLRAFREQRDSISARGLASLTANTTAVERVNIAEQGERLLQQRQRFFEGLRGDLQAYAETIGNLDTEERKLVTESQRLADFVNERVLWVRSTPPIWNTEWQSVGAAFGWLTAPENWASLGSAAAAAFARSPIVLTVVSLLAIALIALSRSLRRRITALGADGANSRATSFAPTAWTLLLTIVAVSGLPLLVWHTAYQIQATPGISEFASAVAGSLTHIALLYGVLDLVRCTLRSEGLAEAHLRWPPGRTSLLRRLLIGALPTILPLAFTLRVLSLYGHAPWRQMLDRLVLVLLLLIAGGVLARILNPSRGALAQGNAPMPLGRRRAYYAVGILASLGLTALAVAGYHFTARELLYRLEVSLATIALAILLYELAMRWLLLAKRRLALAQAKRMREAAKTKATEGEGIGDNPQLMAETVSLTAVNMQTRKLVGGTLLFVTLGALWVIWGEVLPALRGLDTFTLWNVTTEVTATVDDKPVTTTVSSPITLGNLLLSLLVIGITFAAARNIPGLLELAVLQRLRSHAGERAAITTLVRYTIVIIGVVVAFSSLGIEWGKVQWLVAAVSVGLGFGLQEIFANFVSGFIILFERPVRIGDLVTVGDTDGFVTQIRMRATTIVDFDRREMIVPNKEFVTSRLVNWTLTDPITRVVIPVGIAYGSNTELARRLLLEAAKGNELVLSDPKPNAIFRGFGDSSLDFEVRVFIASRDHWPQLVDSMHTAIDEAFREHEIEIPFPQRDVHVRTMGPLGDAGTDTTPTP